MITLLRVFTILPILVVLPACMSLELSPETESSKDLYFQNPAGGFQERSSDNLDGYFVEPKTGNSISIKSSCFDPADPSLDALKTSAFAGMKVDKLISEKSIRFKKRAAIAIKKQIQIDGVPVIVEMMILKKNDCSYLVSHVGVESNFGATAAAYQEFLKNMKAP